MARPTRAVQRTTALPPAPRADAILERLRRLCLALPETTEAASWGHPNFRAGKRTFVALERVSRRPSIAFHLDPVDIAFLLGRPHFFVTPYGRGQWVSVWADRRLDWRLVDRLVRRSYRVVALKRMIERLEGPARGTSRTRAREPL